MDESSEQLLSTLDLKEYEIRALNELLRIGRTSAPNLSEATGIPKARIYGVLESLGNQGFLKVIPGRPKEYQPKSPKKIIARAKENRRQCYQDERHKLDEIESEFVDYFKPHFENANDNVTPTEELFYAVDVGDASIKETRNIYNDSDNKVHIMTKSFEYLDRVVPALEDALSDGISVKVLFLDPAYLSEENREIQRTIQEQIDAEFPGITYRFSKQPMPWRGTLADPSMDYDSGTAIFLVEEKDIPLHMRQAAVTDNASFVAGMNRYFTLIWEHDSVATIE